MILTPWALLAATTAAPDPLTTVWIALIAAIPATIASLAAAVKTIASNNKVEAQAKKVEEQTNAVSAKVDSTHEKLDEAKVKRDAAHDAVTQQLEALPANAAAAFMAVNERIERHKANNMEQMRILTAEVEAQADKFEEITQLKAEIAALKLRLPPAKPTDAP
jgi:hypothetical protein